MKKIVLFVWITAFVLTACQNKNEYTVIGTFANSDQDGQVVYLQQLESDFRTRSNIDSVVVVDGKFVFQGIVKEIPDVQFIVIGENVWQPTVFIAESGKIKLTFDSELKVAVKGTKNNNQFQRFQTEQSDLFEKMMSMHNEFEEMKKADDFSSEKFNTHIKLWNELDDEMQNSIFNFIKSNITTPVGQYLFIDNISTLSDDRLKDLIALITPEFRESAIIQRLKSRIAVRETTAVGKQFTDVKGFNFDGKEVFLSDYAGKGKIVLVDFWASWCGPCIRVMPELIEIYQKYKNQGFEIVGISLDADKENWKKSTENLQITWSQFSNLKGWEEDGAVAYGINYIPQTVLIDKDGIIIGRSLSEIALDFKLEELLVGE